MDSKKDAEASRASVLSNLRDNWTCEDARAVTGFTDEETEQYLRDCGVEPSSSTEENRMRCMVLQAIGQDGVAIRKHSPRAVEAWAEIIALAPEPFSLLLHDGPDAESNFVRTVVRMQHSDSSRASRANMEELREVHRLMAPLVAKRFFAAAMRPCAVEVANETAALLTAMVPPTSPDRVVFPGSEAHDGLPSYSEVQSGAFRDAAAAAPAPVSFGAESEVVARALAQPQSTRMLGADYLVKLTPAELAAYVGLPPSAGPAHIAERVLVRGALEAARVKLSELASLVPFWRLVLERLPRTLRLSSLLTEVTYPGFIHQYQRHFSSDADPCAPKDAPVLFFRVVQALRDGHWMEAAGITAASDNAACLAALTIALDALGGDTTSDSDAALTRAYAEVDRLTTALELLRRQFAAATQRLDRYHLQEMQAAALRERGESGGHSQVPTSFGAAGGIDAVDVRAKVDGATAPLQARIRDMEAEKKMLLQSVEQEREAAVCASRAAESAIARETELLAEVDSLRTLAAATAAAQAELTAARDELSALRTAVAMAPAPVSSHADARIASLQAELERSREQGAKMTAELEASRAEGAKTQKALTATRDTLAAAQRGSSSAKGGGEAASALAAAEQRLASAEAARSAAVAEMTKLRDANAVLTTELSTMQGEVARTRDALAAQQAATNAAAETARQQATAAARDELQRLEAALVAARGHADTTMAALTTARAQVADMEKRGAQQVADTKQYYSAERQKLEAALRQRDDELAVYRTQRGDDETTVRQFREQSEAQLAAMHAEWDALRTERDELMNSLAEKEARNIELGDENTDLKNTRASLHNNVNLLDERVKHLDADLQTANFLREEDGAQLQNLRQATVDMVPAILEAQEAIDMPRLIGRGDPLNIIANATLTLGRIHAAMTAVRGEMTARLLAAAPAPAAGPPAPGP